MKIQDKLGLRIHKEYISRFENLSESDRKELEKRLVASIFDEEPKEGYAPIIKPNADDIFIRDLFHFYSEMIECFDNLNLLSEIVTKFPTPFKKISKIRYLLFMQFLKKN